MQIDRTGENILSNVTQTQKGNTVCTHSLWVDIRCKAKDNQCIVHDPEKIDNKENP